MKKSLKTIQVLIFVSLFSSCSQVKVKPWEKGVLARADMSLESDAQDLSIDDHIYFSKESSSGGRGFAGGGCGCN